jgi:hypothetical protein
VARLRGSFKLRQYSPVAILPAMIALPIASAGRFSPLGPRGINCYLALLGAKHIMAKPVQAQG